MSVIYTNNQNQQMLQIDYAAVHAPLLIGSNAPKPAWRWLEIQTLFSLNTIN